jgi:iron complex transport system substrate-binding protein
VRIVSVLPSATEIVCALGARSALVGRSAECDFPPDVGSVPVVMRPRSVDPESPSRAIDERVRAARARAESLYELDVERLRDLRPDVLLTQDLCGVCSVTDDEARAACAEAGVSPRIVSLTPRTLDQVWESIATVGRAIGRAAEAERLVASLRPSAPRSRAGPAPTVAVVEWLDPPILAGLWTPEIVRAAGGAPLGPGAGEVGQRTTWPAIATLRPDFLVLSPCSFGVDRTRRELEGSALADAVRGVGARRGTVVADEAYFSRPGPRLAAGVQLVASLVEGAPRPLPMPFARWGETRTEVAT